MRSKIEANEYKDYILGFIFYKYLSEMEVKFLRENDFTESDFADLCHAGVKAQEGVQAHAADPRKPAPDEDALAEYLEISGFVKKRIGFFITYDSLFDTWLAMGKDFTIDNVRVSLSAFSRSINPAHEKVFKGIFETLETGLSKLGDSTASQTKAARELLDIIKDIPMDGRQGYDVLGYIYEYLISQFASNAGKKAGEFYTPHEVSALMSEIVAHHLQGKEEISIYDPTSGSGSLLINIGKAVARYAGSADGIRYYAQEAQGKHLQPHAHESGDARHQARQHHYAQWRHA